MSTSVQVKVQRGKLNATSFAHITATPLAADGITPDGLLFDGALTDAQVIDVWWFAGSRDDADEALRRNLALLRSTDDPSLCAALVEYVLGMEAS